MGFLIAAYITGGLGLAETVLGIFLYSSGDERSGILGIFLGLFLGTTIPAGLALFGRYGSTYPGFVQPDTLTIIGVLSGPFVCLGLSIALTALFCLIITALKGALP
jgi:hypothetical protein